MFGALAAFAVDEPLIGQVALPSKIGKLLVDAALYETVTVRWSPLSTMLIVGVGAVEGVRAPLILFAVVANTAAAVAWATASDCISIAGLTAAMAAASVAASNCARWRKACVKSIAMP